MGLLNIIGNAAGDRVSRIYDFSCYVNGVYPQIVDLRSVQWSLVRSSNGTDGSYLKSQVIVNGVEYYLKASMYNDASGFIGVESIAEWLAYQVGSMLYYDVLQQNLIPCVVSINGKEWETVVCISMDYKRGRMRLPIGTYVSARRKGTSEASDIIGYDDYRNVLNMFVLDFIMCQRDRHSSNMEYLVDRRTGSISLAPAFDNGISMTAPWVTKPEMVTYENQMYCSPVNNFLGSHNLESNLLNFCVGNMSIRKGLRFGDLMSNIGKFLGNDMTYYWQQMLQRRYDYAVGVLRS